MRGTKASLSPPSAAQSAGVGINAVLLLAVAAVLAFYCNRIFMALPIYATDEGSYLIHALVPPERVARYPYAADVDNPVFLAIIRRVHEMSAYTLEWLRTLNLAAYIGGILLVYAAATRSLPRRQRLGFLLLALAFPYYRFVVTALPEGWYVGLLGVVVLATARWARRRPLFHAAIAGALTAALVLVKPHGLAVMAGLGVFILIDAILSRRGVALTALRLGLLVVSFLVAGNALMQMLGADVRHPVLFFVSGAYAGILRLAPPEDGVRLALLNVVAMKAAVAMMAAVPLVLGLFHLFRRWRQRRGSRRYGLDGGEAAFLLLALSLGATIAMVGIFTLKVSNNPGESLRLWGRYFEFFVPLLWLAAARPIARFGAQRIPLARLAAAAVALIGLGGLLLSFRAGIALYPWDATAINAFFEPVPMRTFDPEGDVPYRAMAIAATLMAAAATAAGLRLQPVWTAYFAALALLSTASDHAWVRSMVAQREALADELHVIEVLAPGYPTVVVNDVNEAQMVFLDRRGAANVIVGQPQQRLSRFAGSQAVAVMQPRGAEPGWRRIYGSPTATIFQAEPAAIAP